MKKVKVYKKNIPHVEETIVTCNGFEMSVKNRISYDEKDASAQEYMQHMLAIDDKLESAFADFHYKRVRCYLICKYYTNIDVDPYTDDMNTLCDIVMPYWNEIVQAACDDMKETQEMWDYYLTNYIDVYTRQHSLAQKVKTSFGSLLNGEDIMQEFIESREINEQMIDLLNNARFGAEQKERGVLYSWAAKKNK